MKDYNKLAQPLTNFLNMEGFHQGPVAQEAFDNTKELISIAPTLELLDFTKEFIIEYDALGKDIGAILMQ